MPSVARLIADWLPRPDPPVGYVASAAAGVSGRRRQQPLGHFVQNAGREFRLALAQVLLRCSSSSNFQLSPRSDRSLLPTST